MHNATKKPRAKAKALGRPPSPDALQSYSCKLAQVHLEQMAKLTRITGIPAAVIVREGVEMAIERMARRWSIKL